MKKLRKLLYGQWFASNEQQLTTVICTLPVDRVHSLTVTSHHPRHSTACCTPKINNTIQKS